MDIQANKLYHIYNQGNNRQKIFFTPGNYLFFLTKIRLHILPYSDILAWCLMPNHFHLMVYVHTLAILANEQDGLNNSAEKAGNLNDSVGIMLHSYTRAINKQENRTGSLFKPHTKAECVSEIGPVLPSFCEPEPEKLPTAQIPIEDYPQICFDYIHNNPVKSHLVTKPEDWEFSSFRDYAGMRNGKLISRQRAIGFGIRY
jgi:putative transposase